MLHRQSRLRLYQEVVQYRFKSRPFVLDLPASLTHFHHEISMLIFCFDRGGTSHPSNRPTVLPATFQAFCLEPCIPLLREGQQLCNYARRNKHTVLCTKTGPILDNQNCVKKKNIENEVIIDSVCDGCTIEQSARAI